MLMPKTNRVWPHSIQSSKFATRFCAFDSQYLNRGHTALMLLRNPNNSEEEREFDEVFTRMVDKTIDINCKTEVQTTYYYFVYYICFFFCYIFNLICFLVQLSSCLLYFELVFCFLLCDSMLSDYFYLSRMV